MAFKTFEEFLEGKKMEAQPPSDAKELKVDGDTSKQIVQGQFNKPPQGKKANPYAGPNASKPKSIIRVAEKSGKGLADEGSPNMSHKDAIPMGEKPDTGIVKAESTKEYVLNMLNESKQDQKKKEFDPTLTCQFSGHKMVPAFWEVAKHMANMVPQNEKGRRMFVRELKGIPGGLNSLLEELLSHKETYAELAEMMGDPESVAPRRFARAMNESYTNWMNEFAMAQNAMPQEDEDSGGFVPPIAGVGAPPPFGQMGGGGGSMAPTGMPPTGMPPTGVGSMPMMNSTQPSPLAAMGFGMGESSIKEAVDLPINKRMQGDGDDDYQDVDPMMPPDQDMGDMGMPGPDTNMPNPMMQAPPQGTPDVGPPQMGPPTPVEPSGTVETLPQTQPTKKTFGFHHLSNEMVKFDPMKRYMMEILNS